MKICIFSLPYYPSVGGIEQITKTLAYELVALKCDVEVVTQTAGNITEDNEYPFAITRTSSFSQRYAAFKRSDVVLFMNFSYAGVPAALLSGKPIVLSHHGIYRYSGSLKTNFLEFTKRQLTRCFTNISVSQFVAKSIPGGSTVIPNAFDDEIFKISDITRTRDFVYCGRLVTEKGVDVLIDAFKIVLAENPVSTLTIIGDGPEREKLEYRASGIPNEQISFVGILRNSELVQKLREHFCMVIPSICEESFGIAALEGIASCDVVIASNRGGLPEAVGECGVLVEPTIEKLASTMKKMLQSRALYAPKTWKPTFDTRSKHLENHRPGSVAKAYLGVFIEAVGR